MCSHYRATQCIYYTCIYKVWTKIILESFYKIVVRRTYENRKIIKEQGIAIYIITYTRYNDLLSENVIYLHIDIRFRKDDVL